jgi:hypothetical protein
VDWQVAVIKTSEPGQVTLEPFEIFMQRTGLHAGALPNRGNSAGLTHAATRLQASLPDAVLAMRKHMERKQVEFTTGLQARLENTLKELARLQARQMEQLTLSLEKQLETVRRGRFEQRSQQINKVFDEYRHWVHDTLTTEPQPWVQVMAAVSHPARINATGA